MKPSIHRAVPFCGALVVLSASVAWATPQGTSPSASGPMQAQQVIQDWPDSARQAAQEMLGKYGEPDAVTSERLIWEDNGPWVRTIVHKQEIQHNFPVPHKDVLEQVINYAVPEEKLAALARFDGSVVAYRTNGELSTRCDREAANILTLNLANDVIEGKRGVKEAREFAAQTIEKVKQGQNPEYAQELRFETQMASAAADPDREVQVQMASGQRASERSGSGRPGAAAGAATGAAAGAATGREGPSMTGSDLTGKTVVSPDGEEVGEVAGIVMNEAGEQLARVQLDDGFLGIGATEIVLPVTGLTTTPDGKLRTDMTRDKLEALRKASGTEREDSRVY